MSFDQYFVQQQRIEWRGKYVCHAALKEAGRSSGRIASSSFLAEELKRVNQFATMQLTRNAAAPEVRDFVTINYMALLDAVETDDKQECKAGKAFIFQALSQSLFFRQYLKLPRDQSKRVDTIIFDKDGTIVQPLPLFGAWIHQLTKSIYHVLLGQSKLDVMDPDASLWEALGYSPPTEAQPHGSFIANSVVLCGVNEDIKHTMCKWAMAHETAHVAPQRDVQALRSAVSAAWSEPRLTNETVLPMGDVVGLWATLRERHGVRIAVCTSDDREATIEQLRILGLEPDAIVCGDDKLSSKPSPEPIWQICHELDTHPSRCIMIGDTVSDVRAGLNAGCAKVAIVRSDGKVPMSLAQEADYVWDTLHGVGPWLDSRNSPTPKESELAVPTLNAFEMFCIVAIAMSIRALVELEA